MCHLFIVSSIAASLACFARNFRMNTSKKTGDSSKVSGFQFAPLSLYRNLLQDGPKTSCKWSFSSIYRGGKLQLPIYKAIYVRHNPNIIPSITESGAHLVPAVAIAPDM